MKYTKRQISHKRQIGLSLIELMISMVVGLFLLVGVVSNFISTKDLDQKRAAVSEMDANATLAFEVLRQTISHAGYSSIQNIVPFDKAFHTNRDKPSISNPKCGDGSTDRDVNILNNSFHTRDKKGRDFLTVITLADNPCNPGETECSVDDGTNVNPSALVYTDCASRGEDSTRDSRAVSCSTDPDVGMPNPTDAKIYSTFKLFKGGNTSVDKDRVLYCYGSRGGEQPIVDNVEAIQYLYGVREDGTGNIRFRTATQVENNRQWGMVTSVKVGLLLRSSHKYVLDQASTKTSYQLLGQAITIPASDSMRMFRVYSTTINLENKNKGALLPDG